MLTQQRCRNGHQWKQGDNGLHCPFCGAEALDLSAVTATLPALGDAATLPPAVPPSSGTSEAPSFLAEHPRYRILELLGRGGMGAVYKAQHLLMQRTVALKVISDSLTNNPEVVQRFHREVQAVARLSHRSIVAAYDAEQVGDAHFLVMEYVPGKCLSRIVAEKGPLPATTACEWICQAAEGLHHAHINGHVHRDIKPQNLMVTPEGQVKILDFGLARLSSESRSETAATGATELPHQEQHPLAGMLTRAGSMMGTPDFVAPEQATDSRKADIRSDIYSLGCTFYYLLTGKPPFSEGTVIDKLIAHQEKQPEPIRSLRPDVSTTVVQIIDKMMAKRPEDRFASPAEVMRALEPWRIPTVQTAESATERLEVRPAAESKTRPMPATTIAVPAPKRRGRLFLGCAALILVTLLGCGGLITWIIDYGSNKAKEVAKIFQDRTSKDELWQVVSDSWQPPPANANSDQLFPRYVNSYSRIHHDTNSTVEELNLHLPGLRAVYQDQGKQVDVIAALVSEADREGMFAAARDAVNSQQQAMRMSRSSGTKNSQLFVYLVGPWKGAMWWNGGWLFVVRSQSDDDPERLLMGLLRATGGKPANARNNSTTTPAKK